jgi:hypothetical protein
VRRLPLALGALALSFALAGCDVSLTPYAARVGRTTITTSDLNSTLHAIASNASLRCDVQAGSGAIAGRGSDTYDAGFAASKLGFLIDDRLLRSAIAEFGLASTTVTETIANDQLVAALAPAAGGTCTGTGQAILASLPSAFRTLLLRNQRDEDLLAAHFAGSALTPAAITAYGSSHRSTTDLRCVSAILVSSQATANTLRTALVGGASFATLAKANSLDTSSAPNGGALGCHQILEFTAPLNTALASLSVGAISPVVSFNGSFVILTVTGLQAANSSQVAEAMISAGQTAETTYINTLGGTTAISVDPVYGKWQKSSGTWMVTPPAGPPDKFVGNTAAVTPSTLVASSG